MHNIKEGRNGGNSVGPTARPPVLAHSGSPTTTLWSGVLVRGNVSGQQGLNEKGWIMPGIGISVLLLAVGAILDFAVTVSPYQHGFNINNVGVILMIVGAIGLIASLIVRGVGDAGGWSSTRRHRTVIDDGQGNVMRREDVSQ
jgi:hypothetical protein